MTASYKQLKYLDVLAIKLGFRSGRQFAGEILPSNEYGLIELTSAAVSECINAAKTRLATQNRLIGERKSPR